MKLVDGLFLFKRFHVEVWRTRWRGEGTWDARSCSLVTWFCNQRFIVPVCKREAGICARHAIPDSPSSDVAVHAPNVNILGRGVGRGGGRLGGKREEGREPRAGRRREQEEEEKAFSSAAAAAGRRPPQDSLASFPPSPPLPGCRRLLHSGKRRCTRHFIQFANISWEQRNMHDKTWECVVC